MKKKNLFFILIVLILLVSCNQAGSSQTGQQTQKWKVPKPDSKTGVVVGKLVGTDGKMEISGTPFLSKNLTAGQSDVPPTISFSISYDPRAIVNESTGEFYFKDVAPADNYAITILFGVGEMYVVRIKNSEDPLIISVVAGETLDLGEVIVKVND
jgi:hypothetical protein